MTNTDTPGSLGASAYVDQLARLEDASAAEVQRIRHVYREIERRDGAAQWHASLWFRFACVLAVVLMVSISASRVPGSQSQSRPGVCAACADHRGREDGADRDSPGPAGVSAERCTVYGHAEPVGQRSAVGRAMMRR